VHLNGPFSQVHHRFSKASLVLLGSLITLAVVFRIFGSAWGDECSADDLLMGWRSGARVPARQPPVNRVWPIAVGHPIPAITRILLSCMAVALASWGSLA